VNRDVARLGERYGLERSAIASLDALITLLDNDPTAPTTVTAPAEVVTGHLADSLVALELGSVRAAETIADIGAGAGFPGLALAAALPRAHVFLIESAGRKCDFIRRAVAAAGLANASVVHARAEEWPDGHDRADLVTARAVAPLAVVAEYGAPLLRRGGTLVAWKGRRDAADEHSAQAAAAELGLAPAVVHRVRPFPAARDRHLHEFTKLAATPPRYPRRPGAARKRPLGG